MSFYLIIIIISLVGALALSFEKNLRIYECWKYLIPAFSLYAVQFHFTQFKLNVKWTKVLTFLIVVILVIHHIHNTQ